MAARSTDHVSDFLHDWKLRLSSLQAQSGHWAFAVIGFLGGIGTTVGFMILVDW